MSDKNKSNSFKKLLVPEAVRTNLILASLYLSAYEILKSTVLDRIKLFFTFNYANGQPQVGSQYKKEVATNLKREPLRESLLWLQQNDAITDSDIQMFDNIRKHRNEIAHQLPSFLSDADRNINIQNFENIRYLLRKVEIWWIKEVDIPTNPDFDGEEVKDEDIYPGSVLMLDTIIEMAFKDV